MAELIMQEETGTPSTPSSGKWKLYPKSDGWYYLDDAGIEIGPIDTPVTNWTSTFTNLTVGNGTVVSRYVRHGKLVAFQLSLLFGSTTSISGNVSFSLPITASAFGLTLPIGLARFKDATGGAATSGIIQIATSGICNLVVLDSSGTYTVAASMAATVPFTWATSDDLECSGVYFV